MNSKPPKTKTKTKTKTQRRLGRGLSNNKLTLGSMSALIKSIDRNTTKSKDSSLSNVDISLIGPNPHQPRSVFKAEQLAELASSIKKNGIIQPIVIRPEGKKFQLIAGERRLRAAALAGLSTIPAIIREISDKESSLFALIENIQRQDLNPIEEAAGYKKLISLHNATHEELASIVGKSRSSISNSLRLLSLHSTVIEFLEASRLDTGHARALVPLPKNQQLQIAKVIVAKNLSARDAERMAKAHLTKLVPKRSKPSTTDATRIARELSRALNAEVKIEHNQKFKGSIRILFSSNETFIGLLKKLNLERYL